MLKLYFWVRYKKCNLVHNNRRRAPVVVGEWLYRKQPWEDSIGLLLSFFILLIFSIFWLMVHPETHHHEYTVQYSSAMVSCVVSFPNLLITTDWEHRHSLVSTGGFLSLPLTPYFSLQTSQCLTTLLPLHKYSEFIYYYWRVTTTMLNNI